MTYFETILARGGGLITCGEHLGVFVSKAENVRSCPAGWVFVDVEQTTPEELALVVAEAKRGRKAWPSKENGDAPTAVTVRRAG